MKKILLTIMAVAAAIPACATPYLVCDPQATVTNYNVANLGTLSGNVSAQTDGSIKLDLTTLPVGTYTVSVKACNSWGDCSTAATLTFARPATPSLLTNMKLIFQ